MLSKTIASIQKISPRLRIIGFIYLLYFLTAIFGQLISNRGLVTFGNIINLISTLLYALVAVLFYLIFKPVNKAISILVLCLGLLGCANDILMLFHAVPFNINSLAFFGPFNILVGYLIFRSNILPRILGVLMVLSGLGWLIYLTPLVAYLSNYLMVIGFVAEASLMLWLLIKGVNLQQWNEQEQASRTVEAK